MRNYFIIVLISLWGTLGVYGQYSIQSDTAKIEYKIKYVESDSINGTVKAVFAENVKQIAFIKHYKNGKLNGRCLYYYPGGNYYKTMIYGYGDLHGDYTRYDSQGNILIKGKYRYNEKHGYWTDKRKGLVGRYRKGKKHSKWRIARENGKMEHWLFFNGDLKSGNQETVKDLIFTD